LLYISKKIKSNVIYFSLLVVSYLFYLLLLLINKQITVSGVQKLFEYFIVQGFGYSLIAALGIRLYTLRKQHLLYISSLFLLIFVCLMIWNNFAPTQNFKYPPTMYYISYGLFVSYFLFYLLSYERVKKVLNKKTLIFLSNKSLDLYYCHIIPIFILRLYGAHIPVIDNNFLTRFLFLLIGGLILLYFQISFFKLVNLIKVRHIYRRAA
ncbi:hypothetical protein CHH47_12660, partial [Priestia megaterium]